MYFTKISAATEPPFFISRPPVPLRRLSCSVEGGDKKRYRASATANQTYPVWGEKLRTGPKSASSADFFVVNLVDEISPSSSGIGIPILDDASQLLYATIGNVAKIVLNHKHSEQSLIPVYVHCEHGVSRAPSVLLGLLLLSYINGTLHDILDNEDLNYFESVVKDSQTPVLSIKTLISFMQFRQGELSDREYLINPKPAFLFQLTLLFQTARGGIHTVTPEFFLQCRETYTHEGDFRTTIADDHVSYADVYGLSSYSYEVHFKALNQALSM